MQVGRVGRKANMTTPPALRASLEDEIELGPDFETAIKDWNRARYDEGDVRLEKCVGALLPEMAFAIYIWKRARELGCAQGSVNTAESVQKAMDATPFDSEVGVLGE